MGILDWLIGSTSNVYEGATEKYTRLEPLKLITEAESIIPSISDQILKSQLMESLACAYADVGEFTKATKVGQSIKAEEWKNQALMKVAVKQAEVGQLAEAYETSKALKADNLKAWALAEVASEYNRQGQSDKATKLLGEALSIAKEWHTIGKNEALTRIALRYAEVGQLPTACEIVQSIQDDYMKCSALAQLARRFNELGYQDDALGLLSEARNVIPSIRTTDGTAWALQETAHSYMEQGRMDEAIETTLSIQVAQKAFSSGVKPYTLTVLAHKYSRSGDTNKARNMLDIALEAANSIEDDYSRGRALQDVAIGLAGIGQQNQALQTARSIHDVGTKAATLAQLATKCVQTERSNEAMTEAISVAHSIEDVGARIRVVVKIATEALKGGLEDKAEELLRDGMESALLIKDVSKRQHALYDIALAWTEANNSSLALQTAKMIREPFSRAASLLKIAQMPSALEVSSQ